MTSVNEKNAPQTPQAPDSKRAPVAAPHNGNEHKDAAAKDAKPKDGGASQQK